MKYLTKFNESVFKKVYNIVAILYNKMTGVYFYEAEFIEDSIGLY